MADQEDSEKTEEPTHKRLADARRKWNIPKSQEVTSWAALMGLLFSLVTLIPWIMPKVAMMNFKFFETPHSIEVNNESLQGLYRVIVSELFLIVGPLLIFFLCIGLLATYVQVGRTFSWEKIKPQWNKLSPISGIKRLISPRSLVEFGKGLVKLVLLSHYFNRVKRFYSDLILIE